MATREREVRTRISGDPRGFVGAIRTARGALSGLSGDLGKLQALAAKALSFSGVGGTLSFASLIALARGAANTADEMGKLAQRTGVGVEELSRLSYAASMGDATLQDLSAGLRRLADDAATGGKNLTAAGIALLDAGGNAKTADHLFKDVADRFASLPDGVQKTGLAVSLFGKNLGAQLTPMLNAGSKGLKELADESDRFGKTITATQVAHAEEFNDNLSRLQALAQGAAQSLGASLIPALNDLALAFLQAQEEDRKLGRSDGLRTWGEGAAKVIAFVVDAIDGVRRITEIYVHAWGATAATVGAILRRDFAAVKAIRRELENDTEEILMRRLFSDRLAEQQSREVRAAQAGVDAQKKLAEAVLRLQGLRAKASAEANAEELKGVERLKTALQSAWQASIDGARKSREEAAQLLTQAADARQSGLDKAADRRSRSMTPEQQSFAALQQAERARREANFAASSAVIAAYHGDLERSKKLAAEATKQAERAERFAENITNDETAARLFEQLGAIREDALKAQAKIKEAEARNLEEVAQQQNEQIAKAEERIAALKAELEKPVNLQADIAAAESEVKRLQAELDKLQDKTITVTVKTSASEFGLSLPGDPASAPGFAGGGYTGAGSKYQPAGIVHAEEFVVRREIVRQPGVLAFLSKLNAGAVHERNLGRLRGYAEGGLVSDSAAAALLPSARTPIVLQWPDGTNAMVSADSATADEIQRAFRRASLSRGRRS